MSNGEELANCPFCGEPGRANQESTDYPPCEWMVECLRCEASIGWQPTREQAIAAWNRRSSPSAAPNGELGEPVKAFAATFSAMTAMKQEFAPSAVEAAEVVPDGWKSRVWLADLGQWANWSFADRPLAPIYPKLRIEDVPLFASPPPASPSAPQKDELGVSVDWLLEDAPSAPQGVEVPEGWVLVPREPTLGMKRAANKRVAITTPDGTWALALDEAARTYAAMLAAAPAIQTSPEAGR